METETVTLAIHEVVQDLERIQLNCMLILEYIKDQKSVDSFLEKPEQLTKLFHDL